MGAAAPLTDRLYAKNGATAQFAFPTAGCFSIDGPPIKPLSNLSNAVRFAAIRTWL
jgi:hypothetical protein